MTVGNLIQIVRTFEVGQYACTLTIIQPRPGGAEEGNADMRVEWEPDVPPPCSLNAAEVEQYLSGRNKALADFAHEAGISICVVDA